MKQRDKQQQVDSTEVDALNVFDWSKWTQSPYLERVFGGVFVLGSIVFALVAWGWGQENGYDLLNYHLYNAYALLNGRYDFDFAPAQIQTFLNPLPFVPFYGLVYFLKPVVVGMLLGAFHGLTLGILFVIAFYFLGRFNPRSRLILSGLAAIVGVYGPIFTSSVGSSSSDPIFNIYTLIGIGFVVHAIRLNNIFTDSGSRKFLFIGWLFLGAATGLKLVAGIYTLGAFVGLLFAVPRPRKLFTAMWIPTLGGAIGLLLTRGYWMVSLQLKYKSPLFPFFNNIFKSPYYENENFSSPTFLPPKPWDHFLYPFHFTFDSRITRMLHDFRDARYAIIAIVCLAVVVALLVRWRKSQSNETNPSLSFASSERFIVSFFLSSYFIWQSVFSIIRYAIVLESLAGIVLIVLISRITSRHVMQIRIILACFLVIAINMRPCKEVRKEWEDQYFDVRIGQFPHPEEVLILIANNRPWSYLIPYFQPEVRFIGLRNNMNKPWHENLFQEEMKAIIDNHQGQILLISRRLRIQDDLLILNQYGLKERSLNYLKIETDHEADGVGMWRVVPKTDP